jgi:AraC family transcriptional regulator, regulatory protein of adaptative response / methylated-DNA-[protein]-cysteine methyltransferase
LKSAINPDCSLFANLTASIGVNCCVHWGILLDIFLDPGTFMQLTATSMPDKHNHALTAEAMWQAVLTRDAKLDGEFVYAVRTTGIYCRPSCPSRAAKRENVLFFETTVDAAAAGYRACKRCHPDNASLTHLHHEKMVRACHTMRDSADAVSLETLAAAAGMSPFHFQRLFKKMIGVTPKAYFKTLQSERLTRSLAGSPSVTDAIYDAGFSSSGRFYEDAAETLGMTPTRYRKGGLGESIRYAVAPCALGVLLVAATTRGVCAIEFGDSAHTLIARLRSRFANADLQPADRAFKQWLDKILAHVERPAADNAALALPLDIQGTAFQRQVWEALRQIPAGKTETYSELAKRIGKPRAVRAVASACANNNIALLIPCHRVVRTGGALAGYRWGIERKAELLKREAKKK